MQARPMGSGERLAGGEAGAVRRGGRSEGPLPGKQAALTGT